MPVAAEDSREAQSKFVSVVVLRIVVSVGYFWCRYGDAGVRVVDCGRGVRVGDGGAEPDAPARVGSAVQGRGHRGGRPRGWGAGATTSAVVVFAGLFSSSPPPAPCSCLPRVLLPL